MESKCESDFEQQQPSKVVVFSILRDSQCSKCKVELPSRSFLRMEGGQPLCMTCADLDHLVYLPRGDAALTRRAGKHSTLWAVVVRFSRTRKRYERQGVLVEEDAFTKAEEECFSDTEVRARRRERDAMRRREEDEELVERMAWKICQMLPACPRGEALRIAKHTAIRGSGRVGRSAAGRALEEDTIRLAVAAAVRHNHTHYDELLMKGWDRARAREEVLERVDQILTGWQKKTTS
jgi:hypothetical protein